MVKTTSIDLAKYLARLIEKNEEEYVSCLVNEWVYMGEYAKPTNIGKQQAEEALATYQKRAKYLQESLAIYRLYAKEHKIKL
jgi:hypothetical protein